MIRIGSDVRVARNEFGQQKRNAPNAEFISREKLMISTPIIMAAWEEKG